MSNIVGQSEEICKVWSVSPQPTASTMLLAVLPLTREAAAIWPWFPIGAGSSTVISTRAHSSASLVSTAAATKHRANGKRRNHVSCRSGNDLSAVLAFLWRSFSECNSAKRLFAYLA